MFKKLGKLNYYDLIKHFITHAWQTQDCGVVLVGYQSFSLVIQWNPSEVDTIGTSDFVRYSEVTAIQGVQSSCA